MEWIVVLVGLSLLIFPFFAYYKIKIINKEILLLKKELQNYIIETNYKLDKYNNDIYKDKEKEKNTHKILTDKVINLENKLSNLNKTLLYRRTKNYEYYNKTNKSIEQITLYQDDDRDVLLSLSLRILRLERKIYGKSLDSNMDYQTGVDKLYEKEIKNKRLENSLFTYLPTYRNKRRYPLKFTLNDTDWTEQEKKVPASSQDMSDKN